MQIDQAGQGDQAVGVDHGRAGAAEGAARFGDHAVLDDQIGRSCAVELRAAEQKSLGSHLASSFWSSFRSAERSPASSR